MKKVLSIAGSDCSGGAGIQADIKTITAHKAYAMTVITALTAQNTTGVFSVMESSAEFVSQQLKAVFEDIPPDSIKIGMVSNPEIICGIADGLKKYNAKNIVIDPVMVATSGSHLMRTHALKALTALLFPLAALITPNIPEASVLCNFPINTKQDMAHAAKVMSQTYKTAVLLKGGHLKDCADDVLVTKGEVSWFLEKHIETTNTHGTGCTLSSAVACGLAEGFCLQDAIKRAKIYVTGAIKTSLNLGKGNGPLNHMWEMI